MANSQSGGTALSVAGGGNGHGPGAGDAAERKRLEAEEDLRAPMISLEELGHGRDELAARGNEMLLNWDAFWLWGDGSQIQKGASPRA